MMNTRFIKQFTRHVIRLALLAFVGAIIGTILAAFIVDWREIVSLLRDWREVTKITNAFVSFVPKLTLFLIIVALALVVLREIKRDQLFVERIFVPAELSEQGYTDEVIARRIRDEINSILAEIRTIKDVGTRQETPTVTLSAATRKEADRLDVMVPGAGVSLKWIIDYLKLMMNKGRETISGDIVRVDDNLILRLRTIGSQEEPCSHEEPWVITQPRLSDDWGETIDKSLKQAADKYFLITSRDILATYYNKRGADLIKGDDIRDDLSKATAAFQRSIEVRPKQRGPIYTAETYTNWGWALAKVGDLEGAVAKFRKALELLEPCHPKSSMSSAIARGRAYTYVTWGNALKQGAFPQAIEKYQKAVDNDPGYAYAYASWGDALRQKGVLGEAIEKLQKAIKINPKYDYAYTTWGDTLLEMNDLAAAVEKLQRAIRINPKHTHAHVLLGRAFAKQGDHAGAIAKFQEAVQVDPAYAYAYVEWGKQLLDEQQDPAAAIEKYREAVTANRQYDLAYVRWGNALFGQGDHVGAIAQYRNALKVNTEHDYARVRWGEALAAQGDHEGAIAKFQEAVWVSPERVTAYIAWAKFLLFLLDQKDYATAEEKLRDYATAEEKLRTALEINSKHAEALALLGQAYIAWGTFLFNQKDYATAEEKLRKALDIEPEDAEALALRDHVIARFR
jgi:tetratricopeptide (TPR) repeat protein